MTDYIKLDNLRTFIDERVLSPYDLFDTLSASLKVVRAAQNVGHEQCCEVYKGSVICSCSFNDLLEALKFFEKK
jgi:hypothetical protein